MENNKDIGKLIKDKFEDFNVSPSNDLWSKIEADLPKEKKKRRTAFWYYIPVILGILTFCVYTANTTFFQEYTSNKSNTDHTSETNSNSNANLNSNPEGKEIKKNGLKNGTVNNYNTEDISEDSLIKTNHSYSEISHTNNKDNSNELSSGAHKLKTNEVKSNQKKTTLDSEITIAENNAIPTKNKGNLNKKHLNKNPKVIEDTDDENTTTRRKKYSKTVKIVKKSSNYTEVEVVEKYTISITKNSKTKSPNKTSRKSITSITTPINSGTKNTKKVLSRHITNSSIFTTTKHKKSIHKHKKRKLKNSKRVAIFDTETLDNSEKQITIAATNNTNSKIDSLAKPKLDTVKKIIKKEKKLTPKEKNIEIITDEKEFHWAITPIVGLNHIGNYSNTSLIGPNFDSLDKKTDLTYNYGCYLTYLTNQNLSFRIGAIKSSIKTETDLSNFTGGISDISTVNFDTNFYKNYKSSTVYQNIEFYDFSLEGLYTIYKINDFSFDIVGGLSYLTTKTNTLEYKINGNDTRYPLGSSNKIKDMNFSVNLGLLIDFKLNKRFSLVLNPMFKNYMTLPVNKTFNTFQMTLQTGVSYKF
ncbi:MAG: autotransporter outer membrane beta-barrel domain-containing protein [Limnohabitans sp.]|nr:autotransporter outer membrane beta-barrel domain-containing protein [Limnohabitans sp.]